MQPLERHTAHLVPRAEVAARIRALQETLAREEVALAYIDHLTDRLYYAGTIQEGVLLVPAAGEARFYARKSFSRAEQESPLPVEPFPGRRGLAALLEERGVRGARVGLALDVTPAPTYLWLTEKVGAQAVDLALAIRLQKAVKSAWELAQITRAAEQANRVLAAAPELLRLGATELEVSAEIEKRLRLGGHPGTLRIRRPGLELGMIYVVSGAGGLYPTNFDGPDGAEGLYPTAVSGAGRKELAAGETVMIDMVSSYNGYQADTTRLFAVGREVPQEAARAQRFCLDVLARIEAQLKPGANCGAIYRETLAWAQERGLPEGFMGYGENQVKFFGHGVGLDLDGFPILAAKVDLELAENMVIAVEPKAFLTGVGPVGVENTYRITADGCESFCPLEGEIVARV